MSLTSVFTSFTSYRSTHSQQATIEKHGERQGLESPKEPRPQADSVDVSGGVRQDNALTYSAGAAGPKVSLELEGREGRTDAANTILDFVSTRLQLDVAEGATEDELLSRLEAGLSGFVSGYLDAYEQLSGMGFLGAEVEAAIEQTFSDVLDGIDALAGDLGLDSPVTQGLRDEQAVRQASFVPSELASSESLVTASAELAGAAQSSVPANVEAENLRELISASTFNYRESEARSFNFSLTTQDGDTVNIKAAYASMGLLDGERVDYGNGSDMSVSGQFRAASGFYLDVRGEIDEDEMMAIEDLLTQVREVSDMFFAGDIESAFEYAVDMGFNTEEIAEFSLRLRSQSTVRIEESYQGVGSSGMQAASVGSKADALNAKDEALMLIARFVQALEDLRTGAKELGLEGFAGNMSLLETGEKESEHAGPEGIVSDLLVRLEELSES